CLASFTGALRKVDPRRFGRRCMVFLCRQRGLSESCVLCFPLYVRCFKLDRAVCVSRGNGCASTRRPWASLLSQCAAPSGSLFTLNCDGATGTLTCLRRQPAGGLFPIIWRCLSLEVITGSFRH